MFIPVSTVLSIILSTAGLVWYIAGVKEDLGDKIAALSAKIDVHTALSVGEEKKIGNLSICCETLTSRVVKLETKIER